MNFQYKGYYWIVTSNKIVSCAGRLISLGSNAMAITFFPFIFVREDCKNNKELIRHETIHIHQQIELLLLGAVILYIGEYIHARYFKKLTARQAYYYTALEQEAHRNAMNENYLITRKPYASLKYIKDKKNISRDSKGSLITEDIK